MTNRIGWSALAVLTILVPSACTKSDASDADTARSTVGDTVPVVPAKSVADDLKKFFAQTKITGQCPNDTTCVYVQTFITGDSREITLVVSPNRADPGGRSTAGEFGSAPVSSFQMTRNLDAEPSVLNLNYYVGAAGLPNGGRRADVTPVRRHGRGGARLASVGLHSYGASVLSLASAMQAGGGGAAQGGGGAGIAWSEIGKKGADATIGAIIDEAKSKGIPLSPGIGGIYALASALNDVSTALDIGAQNTRWLKELDALEKCAADPSSPTARSDPNYTSQTVAKIRQARSELKEVNSVRFLNQLTEKGADLTPVTAVMAVGLKQGFQWSEQTLGDYSENTIMREARLAVVKCEDPGNPSGNLEYTTTCNLGPNDVTVTKIIGNVSWEWQMGVKYLPRGSYKYEAIRNIGGKCTEKSTGQGSLDNTGYLFVFDDPAQQKQQGYGYEARFVNLPTLVTTTSNCRPGYQLPVGIDFIPIMRGFRGTGGDIEGAITPKNACSPSLKWSFSVPPRK